MGRARRGAAGAGAWRGWGWAPLDGLAGRGGHDQRARPPRRARPCMAGLGWPAATAGARRRMWRDGAGWGEPERACGAAAARGLGRRRGSRWRHTELGGAPRGGGCLSVCVKSERDKAPQLSV